MSRRIAHVQNGIVTQVSEGADDEAQHQAWLAAVADKFDDIVDVTDHKATLGYGVNVGDSYDETDGFRPPSPYPSWVWGGTAWEAPVEKPAGSPWVWDEAAGEWVRPDGYEPPAE